MGWLTDWTPLEIAGLVGGTFTGGMSSLGALYSKQTRVQGQKAQRELDNALAGAERQTAEAMALLNAKPKPLKKPDAATVLYGLDNGSATSLTGANGATSPLPLAKSRLLGS